jgi:hypothetical protein
MSRRVAITLACVCIGAPALIVFGHSSKAALDTSPGAYPVSV